MTSEPFAIRNAGPDDAAAIAHLHAESWRAHYRGSFSDAYLDGPIHGERLQVWTERLRHPRSGQIALLAEEGTSPAGFVCLFLDHDRTFGTLIDNLHVAVDRKRMGLGRQLLRSAGDAMLHALPRRPVYLTVLVANTAAQAFYDRIGGMVAEELRTTEPDGSKLAVLRYIWPSPAALIDGVV